MNQFGRKTSNYPIPHFEAGKKTYSQWSCRGDTNTKVCASFSATSLEKWYNVLSLEIGIVDHQPSSMASLLLEVQLTEMTLCVWWCPYNGLLIETWHSCIVNARHPLNTDHYVHTYVTISRRLHMCALNFLCKLT